MYYGATVIFEEKQGLTFQVKKMTHYVSRRRKRILLRDLELHEIIQPVYVTA